MKLEAHAKVNLTLEVLGVRPDGYHDLRSVVVPIPLHDDVILEEADNVIDASGMDLGEKNLTVKAARALQRATGCTRGVRIGLVKRIPSGAGLGGGSADAAAVLNGLNDFWHLGLSRARLVEIAAEVGSDVPALTAGGIVLMEGRGEKVTPLPDYPAPDFTRFELRTPEVFSSTPAVYAEFRETDRGVCRNDLQPAACRLHPEIAEAIRALEAEGCEDVMMSGSGSAVFGWRKA